MEFEQQLGQQIFNNPNTEKTFIDKVLGRQEADQIRNLVKKPKLKREELLEVLYLLASTESKILNYSEWDRYIILKFFVWIREFVKVAELHFDYRESLAKNNIKLTERSITLLDRNEQLIEHNAKFLIDLYLNIARTSLSVGGTGFMEVLKNKFEITYPNQTNNTPQVENKTSFFGFGGKK